MYSSRQNLPQVTIKTDFIKQVNNIGYDKGNQTSHIHRVEYINMVYWQDCKLTSRCTLPQIEWSRGGMWTLRWAGSPWTQAGWTAGGSGQSHTVGTEKERGQGSKVKVIIMASILRYWIGTTQTGCNTLLKSDVTTRDHVVRCRGSQECGSRNVNFACKFHRRSHRVRITLKSTTFLFMRSKNVWTTKPWQRS